MTASTGHRPRLGFVLEQTLGHITHAANLTSLVGRDERVDAAFAPVEFELEGRARWLPGYTNWTVRAGVRARRAIREIRRGGPIDAMFIHTQVPAILVPDKVARIPTVVSLDATPIQYDELGGPYGHATGSERIERAKWRANRACFARAAAIVTWSAWTKDGLVERYEVAPEKVHVIPPGVDVEQWVPTATGSAATPSAMRVLFVGGDLERKGGRLLVDAVRRLRHDGLDVEVDLVTRDELAPEPGIHVHHGLGPNSPGLIERYRAADVFCLPTFGDCLPMVLSEAGAMGIPLVSTDVGAIGEIVRDDHSGLLVPVGDGDRLTAALRRLAADPGTRQRLGEGAARLVHAEYDAAANARRIVDLMLTVSGRS